jgi:hypothetical protein
MGRLVELFTELITFVIGIFRVVGEIVKSHPSTGVRDVMKVIAGYDMRPG